MKGSQQAAYLSLKDAYKVAEATSAAHERRFLSQRNLVDERGRPVRHLWQIRDLDLFDALATEYENQPEAARLSAEYTAARVAFVKAERALVAFALSLLPEAERTAMEAIVGRDGAAREKVIALALRLAA